MHTGCEDVLVFVVDDDEAVRNSVGMLLRAEGIKTEIFSSAEQFLESYDSKRPGCLLLDVRMPGMSGLELQQRLSLHALRIPIIFMTGHGDITMAVHAMKGGAIDFVEKPFDYEKLLNSVRECISRCVACMDDKNRNAGKCAKLSGLTPREQEIAALLIEGLLNKQIAARLEISVRTVEHHRASIMKKLRIRSLPELVHMALASSEES